MDKTEMNDGFLGKKTKNPADMVQFDWKCCFDDPEKRNILKKELPELFNYKIDRFKVIEVKNEPHESKFETEFTVDVCTEKDRDDFISQLQNKTGTNFNKASSDRVGKGGWKQRNLKCSRNVRSMLSTEQARGGRGSGSGHVRGVGKQEGKNQNCKTTMKTRLYPCNEDHSSTDDCFKLNIDLSYNHSHEVESTNSYNFLEVEVSAKLRLLELFENGLTPSRAKKEFEEELKLKYSDQWLEVSSKRSINPDKNYIFRLHTSYWSNKFGTINGPEAYEKAKDFIDSYNEKAGHTIASIKQMENGGVVVCVVDEFMQRVHTVVPQSGQIMFVDATGSLDRCNHQLLKLMTESPVGGVPLGFIILSEQTENALSEGLEDIKKLFPDGAFAGRGIEEGPEVIMTDDDSVSIISYPLPHSKII